VAAGRHGLVRGGDSAEEEFRRRVGLYQRNQR
jgi:hypothetical protein